MNVSQPAQSSNVGPEPQMEEPVKAVVGWADGWGKGERIVTASLFFLCVEDTFTSTNVHDY